MILTFDKLMKLLLLGFFFSAISFSLGYHTINSFIPEAVPEAADAFIYKDLVVNGPSAISQDHRSSRILIPMVAHVIYKVLPLKVGSWDTANFSLLIVNSFICSIIGIIIFYITLGIKGDSLEGLLASLLFFLNFAIPNYYLSSLVDSGECLFSLLLFLVMYNNKWFLLPVIGVLGVLTKETFLPVSFLFIASWLFVEWFETKKLNVRRIIYFVVFMILSVLTVIILKSIIFNRLMFPWDYAKTLLKPHVAFASSNALSEIRRFFYVFIWLLPFSIMHFKNIPKIWRYSSLSSVIVIAFLSIWAGTSGAATSRYIFNYIGPMLCISSCWFMKDLVKQLNFVKD